MRMLVGDWTWAFALEPRVGDLGGYCSVDSQGLEVLWIPSERLFLAQSGALSSTPVWEESCCSYVPPARACR